MSLALLPLPARALTPSQKNRIDNLVADMTVEEKAGQLSIFPGANRSAAADAINPATVSGSKEQQAEQVHKGEIGALFNGAGLKWHREMQEVAVTQSRLKIPLLFAADIIHGFRTIFPIPLAEASSFDMDLAERTARAAAIEGATEGFSWTFAPMVDIARDARWGRSTEGSGEDVLLGKDFSVARVKGFQGNKGLADPQSLLSTVKHFAAYGAAISGLDYNPVDISERTLIETYFPPFKAGIDAGSLSVMAAFNDISGVPAHANKWLMEDVLRKQWGFDGLVVSDYTGDLELVDHGFAKDERDAARLAIMAGVDMSMTSGLYLKYLPDLVKAGEVPMARVDQAVRRVLELKEKLGLFADPFNRLKAKKAITAPTQRKLAHEAALRSVVMLKNENSLLPLPTSGKKIALIGPSIDLKTEQNGSWVIWGRPDDTTPLDAVIRKALKDPANLVTAKGSGIEEPLAGGIEEAVKVANSADIVVLVIGEGERMAGESKSRVDIVVPPPQQELAEAIAKTGKPVVVVLKNGRALALSGAVADASSILVTWFLGTESSAAISDILFGKSGPSGRLPCSFPHVSGQSPYHYDHKPTGRPVRMDNPNAEYRARFREVLNTAAFPFGHGLTYGDISYSNVDVGSGKLTKTGALTVKAVITNTGKYEALEVAQLYIRDRYASITRPVRELKGYQHISLKPGESKTVTFTLKRPDLLFVGQNNEWTVEPGTFDIWIAPSAEAGNAAQFELLA